MDFKLELVLIPVTDVDRAQPDMTGSAFAAQAERHRALAAA